MPPPSGASRRARLASLRLGAAGGFLPEVGVWCVALRAGRSEGEPLNLCRNASQFPPRAGWAGKWGRAPPPARGGGSGRRAGAPSPRRAGSGSGTGKIRFQLVLQRGHPAPGFALESRPGAREGVGLGDGCPARRHLRALEGREGPSSFRGPLLGVSLTDDEEIRFWFLKKPAAVKESRYRSREGR